MKSYESFNRNEGFFAGLVRTVFKTFSLFILFLVGIGLIGALLFFWNILGGLPDVTALKTYHHSVATQVYSDDGRKIGEFTAERRYPVKFDSIPQYVLSAFVAAEDSNFWEHKGIDLRSFIRAVITNVIAGKFAQGGSTITQQVARTLLLTRKKEITRKIREMILARRIEQQLTKKEILNLYLSEIYLGHGAFGIGAAAQNYFGKKVEELTLSEGALLAGLPQRPTDWDPFRSPGASKRRQAYVLKRMVEERIITPAESDEAFKENIRLFRVEDLNTKAAPYFTEYVRQYLMKKYGDEKILSQGYKVYTTVRYDFQKEAERSVDRGLREVDKRLGWRGPIQNLESIEKVKNFLATVHDEIMEKECRTRILPFNADDNLRKLPYDLNYFEQRKTEYFGITPIKEGHYYSGAVLKILEPEPREPGGFLVRIGETTVKIPFSTMQWVKVEDKPILKIGAVLRLGDVVQVRIDKIERKEGVVHGSLEQEPEVQGAILSYEIQTGFVRAMVGGTDFVKSPFNRALQSKRQVGSTFKPLVYAAAIDKGFSPSSQVTDSPIVFRYEGGLDADTQGEDWRPHNYTGSFEGEIPLRLALVRSLNIPTVKILNEIGVDYGIAYARALGITAELPRELTIALGSWSSSLEELTRAYSVFPRWGKGVNLIYIKKVLDEFGKVIEELPSLSSQSVLANVPSTPVTNPPVDGGLEVAGPSPITVSPQTAYMMTDMLRSVISEGTGRGASGVPGATAGKTGTSNDHRDAWFVGYTPSVMTGVWIGFDKDRPLPPGETGGRAAAPLWAEYMNYVVKNYPKGDFPVPEDISFAYVESDSGRLATSRSSKRVRVAFKEGLVPTITGDNLPRIGEPGTRGTSGNGLNESSPLDPPKVEDTDDYIRQGYDN